jgi:hypothetical protein
VVQAYDRFEVNGNALRREIGVEDDDKPTDDELIDMVMKKAATQAANQLAILAQLKGTEPAAPPQEEPETEAPVEEDGQQGPPETEGEPPPPPDEDLPVAAASRVSPFVTAGTPVDNRATRRRRSNGKVQDPATID